MAIKYLDAKRIRGSSVGGGGQTSLTPANETDSAMNASTDGVGVRWLTGNDIIGKNVVQVSCYFWSVGSPTGTLHCKWYNSSGTAQQTSSTTVDMSTISGSATEQAWTFAGYEVEDGDFFGFTATGDNIDGTNKIAFQVGDDDYTYTNGMVFQSSSWATRTWDGKIKYTVTQDDKATLVTTAGVASDWTESGSKYTLTDNQIDFALKRDGSYHEAYVDLGADASSTWVLRMHINFTGNSSGDGYAKESFWGLSSTTGNHGASQDSAGVLMNFSGTGGSGDNRFTVSESDDQALGAGTVVSYASLVVTPTGEWWVEIKRTASATITLGVYTDATYGTLVSGTSVTSNTAFSGTGLRYVKFAIPNHSNQGEIQNGTVDTIEFYDNMTTASGTPTKFLSDASTDLPENTLFDETDTYSQWWLQDSKWIMSSPKWIDDLTAWYDASDINSVTKNSSNLVSQLNDKSGNGYNLTASGTGDNGQPLWVSGGKNSLDVINFASNKIMRAQWTAKDQPTTICAVLYTPASDGGQDNLWDNYNDTESSMGFVNSDTNNRLSMFAPNNIIYPSSGATTYAQTWTFFVNTYNGSSSSMRINGVEKVTGNCGSNDSFGLTLSTHRTGNNWGQIKLAEMMVFDKALSDSEITAVNNYFSKKWGITIGS